LKAEEEVGKLSSPQGKPNGRYGSRRRHWTDGDRHIMLPEDADLEPGMLAGTPVLCCVITSDALTELAREREAQEKMTRAHMSPESVRDFGDWLACVLSSAERAAAAKGKTDGRIS
jgi:hypothetical protein